MSAVPVTNNHPYRFQIRWFYLMMKFKVTGYHAHLRAGRNGCLKKTLIASRLFVWLKIALHIQLEQRLHFVFSKNGG